MATYSTISEAESDPGAPGTSQLVKRLRDNPIAVWEGDATAPRIDPINAMAHQGVFGAIGTYVFATRTTGDVAEGVTAAGSGLRPTAASYSFSQNGGAFSATHTIGAALSGTWRCMGRLDESITDNGNTNLGATLWLRVA